MEADIRVDGIEARLATITTDIRVKDAGVALTEEGAVVLGTPLNVLRIGGIHRDTLELQRR